jgi:antitoxin (DNA-binding transcriptional repressor) of toxin-antitoxin stability system
LAAGRATDKETAKEPALHTLTTEDLEREPRRLLADAHRGQASLVTRDGEPVMLALPLGPDPASREMRLDLAASLYDRNQISLGLAARIAGLCYGDMMDELGRRGIATIRLMPGDQDDALA